MRAAHASEGSGVGITLPTCCKSKTFRSICCRSPPSPEAALPAPRRPCPMALAGSLASCSFSADSAENPHPSCRSIPTLRCPFSPAIWAAPRFTWMRGRMLLDRQVQYTRRQDPAAAPCRRSRARRPAVPGAIGSPFRPTHGPFQIPSPGHPHKKPRGVRSVSTKCQTAV